MTDEQADHLHKLIESLVVRFERGAKSLHADMELLRIELRSHAQRLSNLETDVESQRPSLTVVQGSHE